MQLAALSCVLYVMQYFISIIHSYSGVDYRLQKCFIGRDGTKLLEFWRLKKKKLQREKERERERKRHTQRERDWIIKREFDSWWNYGIIMLSCDYLHSMMRGDEGNYAIESRHLLSSRNTLTMFGSQIFQNVWNWEEIMFAKKCIILILNSNTGREEMQP